MRWRKRKKDKDGETNRYVQECLLATPFFSIQ